MHMHTQKCPHMYLCIFFLPKTYTYEERIEGHSNRYFSRGTGVCVYIYTYIHALTRARTHAHTRSNNEREQEMDDADHASLWAVCMLRAIVQAKEQSWEGICGSTASSR